MLLRSGTRIGPYEIVAELGKGGMGEVYRAHDARLGRDVALKFLPETLAADPDRRQRFEREARALAALNHSNIAQIYGVEAVEAADVGHTADHAASALVMELVEGPTLADVIATRGALDAAEAVAIAMQIASALDAAHGAGIIHRDLKPANIKVRDDGTVKVLDFGLAKAAADAARSPIAVAESTTRSPAATELGVILGTAAYMSPEQASGRAVDKRADVWSFGVVLYEMLAGRRLFSGDTVAEIVASVIKDAPTLDALPASTPAHIRRVLAACLERDPKARLRDAGDARWLLAHPDAHASVRVEARTAGRRGNWATVAAGLLFAVAAGAAAWWLKPSATVPMRRVDLPSAMAARTDFALAPDGSALAYISGGHLYVRDLGALEPRDLGAVSASASGPFWSPDGQHIGFNAESSLRTIPAAGGPPFVVCRVPATGSVISAAWRTDGSIVFSVWRDSLYVVPASGGTPAVFLAVDSANEIDFHSVNALPDGRVIIETHRRNPDGIQTEITDGHTRALLTADGSIDSVTYVAPARVLFLRAGANAGLWTAPFSTGAIDVAHAELVQAGADAFTASADGTLVYHQPATVKSSLVWFDRTGQISPIPGTPVVFAAGGGGGDLALSPDGRRAAFFVDAQGSRRLVIRDLESGLDTPVRLPAPDSDAVDLEEPAWFPSGDRIAYAAATVQGSKVLARRLSAGMDTTVLASGLEPRISRDGHALLFVQDDRGRGRVQSAPLNPDGTVGTARPVFRPGTADEPNVRTFDLSPDGTMLAVAEVGTSRQVDIFLTDFPAASNRWIVTTTGGGRPRFSADGRELFYMTGTRDSQGRTHGQLIVRPVTLHPPVTLGAPSVLFDEASRGVVISGFGAAPDGRRFLTSVPAPTAPGEGERFVLVQNWLAAIPR